MFPFRKRKDSFLGVVIRTLLTMAFLFFIFHFTTFIFSQFSFSHFPIFLFSYFFGSVSLILKKTSPRSVLNTNRPPPLKQMFRDRWFNRRALRRRGPLLEILGIPWCLQVHSNFVFIIRCVVASLYLRVCPSVRRFLRHLSVHLSVGN